MRSTISIMGLYDYDSTIFDQLQLPDGISKTTVTDLILEECAELEIIYPDPSVMKKMIGAWSKAMSYRWKTLAATENFNYNPIWNKDGTYRETETRDLKTTDAGSNNSTGESSGTAAQEALNSVSAFDSSGYSNRNKDTQEASDSQKSSAQGSYQSAGTDTGTVIHERIEQGNIGVTTTQQMIKEEREIADFSIYKVIVNDFSARFCLLVY